MQSNETAKGPLSADTHSNYLSDLAAIYVRRAKHRGQLKVINGVERLIGRRRWNVRTRHGFRIAVDINDFVQKYIMETGSWDCSVASALEQRWSKNDVFMDIGANIGLFSLLALKQGLRHVVAFEPLPSLAELATLHAGLAKQLAVLLLRHPLAALLDDGAHTWTFLIVTRPVRSRVLRRGPTGRGAGRTRAGR